MKQLTLRPAAALPYKKAKLIFQTSLTVQAIFGKDNGDVADHRRAFTFQPPWTWVVFPKWSPNLKWKLSVLNMMQINKLRVM